MTMLRYFDLDLKVLGKVLEIIYKQKVGTYLRQRRFYNYIDKYIEVSTEFNEEKIMNLNNPVWICWLDGIENAPNIVKKCYESMHNNLDSEIILITEDNYRKYITIPDYIERKYQTGKIGKAHFSDVLRIELISTYGGCWIDSTVYAMDKVPISWYKSDFFVFNIPDYGREFKISANWWICAKKNHPIILSVRKTLYNYWKYENKAHDYLMFHKMFKKLIEFNSDFNKEFLYKEYFEVGYTHRLDECDMLEYSSNMWNEIKRNCPVQKLTWHKNYDNIEHKMIERVLKK